MSSLNSLEKVDSLIPVILTSQSGFRYFFIYVVRCISRKTDHSVVLNRFLSESLAAKYVSNNSKLYDSLYKNMFYCREIVWLD